MLIKIYKDKLSRRKSSLNNISESSGFFFLLSFSAPSWLLEFLSSGKIPRVAKSSQNYSSGCCFFHTLNQGLRGFIYFSNCEHGAEINCTERVVERVPHTGPRHGACWWPVCKSRFWTKLHGVCFGLHGPCRFIAPHMGPIARSVLDWRNQHGARRTRTARVWECSKGRVRNGSAARVSPHGPC